MGINPTKIRRSNTSFKGVMPGPYAHCTGSLLLEVVFGSADNSRREKLVFHIAPFNSSYQALLGREAFASLTQYRITLPSCLRCLVHVESLQ